MSFREEENQRNCPSRGLGLAAAAIGVGVGAALYYFFSKRPENPAPSGSTSEGWHQESDRAFLEETSESYLTVSEHTTTDTSVFEDEDVSVDHEDIEECSDNSDSDPNSSPSNMSVESSPTDYELSDNESSDNESSDNELSDNELSDNEWSDDDIVLNVSIPDEMSNLSDSAEDFDIIDFMTDVPVFRPTPILPRFLYEMMTRRLFSRSRSTTEEQCSICFDMIVPNQECMSLPCTHFFHESCILPWLEQQQTCPNCRKNID